MTDLTGDHFIAGHRVASDTRFDSTPVSGAVLSVSDGGAAEVDVAMRAAEDAFETLAATDGPTRAALLRGIAEQIEARADAIAAHGTAETGLPEARLRGETGRTTGQLRMFADFVEAGSERDTRHDPALPDRSPLPRPDLHMVMRPIGPVAVFGASNFPLAFSTAGGDTASALAAGCPVVVKGHPAHPATGELVAEAIAQAVSEAGLPGGTFSLVQGSGHDLGRALVEHPLTAAVGFTGSLGAGRALFDLCARRAVPIPFFGELGSINPVFVLPAALAARGREIAEGWAASLTMGAGQFCTNPGLLVLPRGAEGDAFLDAAVAALEKVDPQVMLTDDIAEQYGKGRTAILEKTERRLASSAPKRQGAPGLSVVDAAGFAADPGLAHEVFGPFGLVVRADPSAMVGIARDLDGQLTCTLQMDAGDRDLAASLLPVLERKAGRILCNGFPTGVEVASAMVHSGPYPASTNFGHTSVGTLAIRRWLRPVCYQDMPDDMLPS